MQTTNPRREEEIKKKFEQYDKDKDGMLNRDELRQYYLSCNKLADERTIDNLISRWDTNKDGGISLDEFNVMVTQGIGLSSRARPATSMSMTSPRQIQKALLQERSEEKDNTPGKKSASKNSPISPAGAGTNNQSGAKDPKSDPVKHLRKPSGESAGQSGMLASQPTITTQELISKVNAIVSTNIRKRADTATAAMLSSRDSDLTATVDSHRRTSTKEEALSSGASNRKWVFSNALETSGRSNIHRSIDRKASGKIGNEISKEVSKTTTATGTTGAFAKKKAKEEVDGKGHHMNKSDMKIGTLNNAFAHPPVPGKPPVHRGSQLLPKNPASNPFSVLDASPNSKPPVDKSDMDIPALQNYPSYNASQGISPQVVGAGANSTVKSGTENSIALSLHYKEPMIIQSIYTSNLAPLENIPSQNQPTMANSFDNIPANAPRVMIESGQTEPVPVQPTKKEPVFDFLNFTGGAPSEPSTSKPTTGLSNAGSMLMNTSIPLTKK